MFAVLSDWAQAGAWGYLAVAVAAATPWLEILLVIPPAVALGMDPLWVGVVAFAGNYAPVAALVVAWDRWRQRRPPRAATRPTSRRRRRARRLLARYGVPGLALLGPLVTGIHLATALVLATGASRRAVLGWTGASLLAWTVVITVASAAGVGIVASGP